MSEQASQSAKEVVTMETPMFLNTKWAAVAVYGWKNISSKLLEIFGMLLNLPFWNDGDHGIRSIHIVTHRLFRWDYTEDAPKKPLAECWPQTGAVGIDLGHTFDRGVVRCIEDNPNSSVYAWYILNLLANLLHEAHHLAAMRADGQPEDREEAAEKFAHESLMDVAKQFVIEPAEWTKEPFFRDTVLGDGLDHDDITGEWLDHQLHMLDNRLFFHLPESDEGPAVKCHTFKDYLHLIISGDEPDDETWLGTPVPVAPIAKAAADVVPSAPATEAVETMAEQKDNIVPPAEATPASNVICLGPGDAAEVKEQPNGDVTITPQPAPVEEDVVTPAETFVDEAYEDMEGEVDEAYEHAILQQTERFAASMQTTQPAPSVSAAIQQVYGNTPPTPTPVSSPEVNVYPPTSMDDNTLIGVVQGLYFKAYNHIFSYCGQINTGFSHPSKVYELQLELTPEEAEAVVSMDCLDPNGRWCPKLPSKVQGNNGQVTARILGAETKNTKLPYYKLYINANGRELCRMLLPQNPLKQNNGQFSKPALAAQSGSRIMYVFEGNDDIVRAGGKKVIGKIVDGRWES